jgi:hypothetical protein
MDSIQSLSSIVDPTIFEIFEESKDQLSSELQYTKLGYKDYMPSIPNPKFTKISGLSSAQITLEGEPYNNESHVQGYPVEVTARKWSKMCTYTEELVHYIMQGNKEYAQEFKDGAQAVMQSVFQRIDEQAARLLYLAHTTTHQAGGDGVALAAYNHPSPEPGVAAQRNIPLTTEGHEALTYDSLVRARTRLNRMYDLKGVQMKRENDLTLLVAAEQEDAANRLVKSSYKPGGDLNDVNTLQSINVQVIEWQPASRGSQWALVSKRRMARQCKAVFAWKPRVMSETEYKNGTFSKPCSTMMQTGFSDYTFGYFSLGDGSVVAN